MKLSCVLGGDDVGNGNGVADSGRSVLRVSQRGPEQGEHSLAWRGGLIDDASDVYTVGRCTVCRGRLRVGIARFI